MRLLIAISVILVAASAYSQTGVQQQDAFTAQNDRSLKSFVLLQGIYTRALGNLSTEFPSAAGGYLGYGIFYPDRYVLMLMAGYSNYRLSDEVPASADLSLSAIHLMAGPRYYFTTDGLMPYVYLNIGLNIVKEKSTISKYPTRELVDRTSGQFAWQVGFGLMLVVVGDFGVSLDAKYNSHFLHHEAMMTGFEYGLGLTWNVGR
jgi:opacity protein-like surface antigen